MKEIRCTILYCVFEITVPVPQYCIFIRTYDLAIFLGVLVELKVYS
jgi:hypothetical protein